MRGRERRRIEIAGSENVLEGWGRWNFQMRREGCGVVKRRGSFFSEERERERERERGRGRGGSREEDGKGRDQFLTWSPAGYID